ncbi:tetratricopeptide repeat protein 4 isoform X2 [Elgaria multicarinata webbii]|uniref:tetratricopeptide repeat protein 4 isoform X2 n=1 Tax=Elgaria multicarinata webbii TaxID=159646 RepID=UPI002FCD692A
MAETADGDEADLDAFLEKFRGAQRYEGALSPTNWEQEFDQIPMFMKKAPSEIDPKQNPDLACLQSIIFDEEQTLEGNYRSALNDAIAARKLKPNHLKAITRGALCHLELKHFLEAMTWCEEGLRIDPKEKTLLETRTKADRLKRTEERDLRKAKLQEKREQSQKDALLKAIKDRNIKLSPASSKEDTAVSEGFAEMSLDGLGPESAVNAKVCLDENASLTWPVLFLYPEHGQTDFISAFHEGSRFIDHLTVMFEELPPWDVERKYLPSELELYFEDEERAEIYQIDTETTLLKALQHQRYFVKAGTPTFLVLVKLAPFSKNYFFGKKVHQLK